MIIASNYDRQYIGCVTYTIIIQERENPAVIGGVILNMCIYYRTTFTNKRILWNKEGESVLTHFKCGHCFECMQELSNEINFRAFHEAIETFKKGGYTIFDTLSYAEKYVPHINDVLGTNFKNNFYCFRKSDIVNFLKLLRIRIERIYNETNTLKVFYTGEYGADDRYTHRPHIHIIFYYTGKCKPVDLSLMISDCWKYGRTDGVKYKGRLYFEYKRLFTNSNSYNLNQTRYISKYIQKESKFDYMIKLRCNKLIKELKCFDNNLTYTDKLLVRKKLNCIRQFRRISNNFGISALSSIDWNNVLNGDSFITMPDSKVIVKKLCIPRYYIRKKFQNLVYYNIGKEVFTKWEWNKEGETFIKNKFKFNIEHNTKKIMSLNSTWGKYNLEIKNVATYENERGKLLDNNFNYLINYNMPKYKEIYNKDICLTDKPIGNNETHYNFNNIKYLKDDELDIVINSLKCKQVEQGKKRHKRYLLLKELENKYKAWGLLNA